MTQFVDLNLEFQTFGFDTTSMPAQPANSTVRLSFTLRLIFWELMVGLGVPLSNKEFPTLVKIKCSCGEWRLAASLCKKDNWNFMETLWNDGVEKIILGGHVEGERRVDRGGGGDRRWKMCLDSWKQRCDMRRREGNFVKPSETQPTDENKPESNWRANERRDSTYRCTADT